MFFITNTLPKPILLSLTYRLSVLQLSSRVLPTIGADAWDATEDDEERPVSPEEPRRIYLSIHCLPFADEQIDTYSANIPASDLCHHLHPSLTYVIFLSLCLPLLRRIASPQYSSLHPRSGGGMLR